MPDGFEQLSNVETLCAEIDVRTRRLLENCDTTEVFIDRVIPFSENNWLEIRSELRSSRVVEGYVGESMSINGTTNPGKEQLGECPHGVVFSMVADKSGRFHGICAIEPELFRVFLGLENPALETLTAALMDLTTRLSVTEDSFGIPTWRLPSDSAEAAALHHEMLLLLSKGTVHTRKTRHLQLLSGPSLFVESNELSGALIADHMHDMHETKFRPLKVVLHSGQGQDVVYYRTSDGSAESRIEPSNHFEKIKDFASSVIHDRAGKVVGWQLDTRAYVAHQQKERELGMYKPGADNLLKILSELPLLDPEM